MLGGGDGKNNKSFAQINMKLLVEKNFRLW